ncbi:hypothetical protein TH47_01700 [Thalassospira sp. MCCC 1A02803]|nr:hypothetical protein TH47_01700 [Thalassospira sp. MCCC 1A02803]
MCRARHTSNIGRQMAELQELLLKKRQKTFNLMEKVTFLLPVLSQIAMALPV